MVGRPVGELLSNGTTVVNNSIWGIANVTLVQDSLAVKAGDPCVLLPRDNPALRYSTGIPREKHRYRDEVIE